MVGIVIILTLTGLKNLSGLKNNNNIENKMIIVKSCQNNFVLLQIVSYENCKSHES